MCVCVLFWFRTCDFETSSTAKWSSLTRFFLFVPSRIACFFFLNRASHHALCICDGCLLLGGYCILNCMWYARTCAYRLNVAPPLVVGSLEAIAANGECLRNRLLSLISFSSSYCDVYCTCLRRFENWNNILSTNGLFSSQSICSLHFDFIAIGSLVVIFGWKL